MGLLVALLMLPLLVMAQEKRTLVYAGVLTGTPESYSKSIRVVSGNVIQETCTCPVEFERDIRNCVDRCVKRFENKVKRVWKKKCRKLPRSEKAIVYGAGDVRITYSEDDATLKNKKVSAKYEVSVVTVYGTGFCAVLRWDSE